MVLTWVSNWMRSPCQAGKILSLEIANGFHHLVRVDHCWNRTETVAVVIEEIRHQKFSMLLFSMMMM